MELQHFIFLFIISFFSYMFLVNMTIVEGATSSSDGVSNSELMSKLNTIESKIDGNSCLTVKDVKSRVLK